MAIVRARIGRRRPREEAEAESAAAAKKKKEMTPRQETFWLPGGVRLELDPKYAPSRVLGSGAYGVVCSCVNRETNEAVAIKKISNAFDHESTALRTLREIQILRRIGTHDNIISLKDVMLSNKADFRDVYLVQELMDIDLSRVIPSLTGSHIRSIIFQILRGLKFLHSSNVIHRDLKPQNILLNKNTDVKICDFGLARTKRLDPQKMTEYVVTRWYRAPELLTGPVGYGPAIDVWSAGCILAEMHHGSPILRGESSLDQVNKVFDLLGTPSDVSFIQSLSARKHVAALPRSNGDKFNNMFSSAEPLLVDLMKKMLALNPRDRISASKALEHPYFSQSGLYDPDCDASSPATINLEVDDIQGVVDTETIRGMMWEEMLFYRPQERSQELVREMRPKEQQINAKLEAARRKLEEDYQKTMPIRQSIEKQSRGCDRSEKWESQPPKKKLLIIWRSTGVE